jgi:hyperosmotically inducible protein
MFRISAGIASILLVVLAGCSNSSQTPAVAGNIHKSLEQAGLRDISVTQDRDKGVVTLGGHVLSDGDRTRADQVAVSLAGGQVVANQIAVLPASDSGPTKTLYADLDKGIDNNLDAALISNGYDSGVHHSVKNGVVTLTGTVDTDSQRTQIETIAHGVLNAEQVVNEIQTRHQKATSSNR